MIDLDLLKKQICKKIVTPIIETIKVDPYKNTIDPFSAVIDSILRNIDLSTWFENELHRQAQKSFQNKIGDLHEIITTSFEGWEKADEIIDVFNNNKKIIAEIKNKWNTTKGNHKVQIYNDIEACLNLNKYKGFTGYYVEVLPKDRKTYNEVFTPTDNKKGGQKKAAREDIRRIDGKSFYNIVSGREDCIEYIYNLLPKIIYECLASNGIKSKSNIEDDTKFQELLHKTYKLP